MTNPINTGKGKREQNVHSAQHQGRRHRKGGGIYYVKQYISKGPAWWIVNILKQSMLWTHFSVFSLQENKRVQHASAFDQSRLPWFRRNGFFS